MTCHNNASAKRRDCDLRRNDRARLARRLCHGVLQSSSISYLGIVVLNNVKFAVWMVVCGASVALAADSVDVSMLKFDEYRELVIRKPLLEKAVADSGQGQAVRALAQAALYFRTGAWDSAFVIYKANQKSIPDIEGQVLMRMARCALELGMADTARSFLLSTPSLVKNRPWWEKADRILAEALLRDTSYSVQARIDSLEARIKAKPSDSYKAWLRLQQGLLLQGQEEFVKARDLFVEVLRNPDYRGAALEALVSIKEKVGYPQGTWPLSETVLRICKANNHKECVSWVDTLLMRPDLDKNVRTSLLVAQAGAWGGLEKPEKAADLYQYLLDSVDLRPGWMQSLMRIQRKSNKAEAKRLDSLFRAEFPYSPENANNLWVTALELEQSGNYMRSFLEYARLLDSKFGKSPRRQWALFRMGYLWYKQQMFYEAAQILEPLVRDSMNIYPQVAAMFFRAECFHELRDDSLARFEYLRTIRSFPLSWYAHRARARLWELKLLDSTQIPWVRVFTANEKETLAWIRKKLPRNTREEKGTDKQVAMIETLFLTGFEEEARQVLQKSINVYGKRADFLYEMGRMFMRVGDYAEAFRMARGFLEFSSRRWMGDMPRPLAELLYPLPPIWKKDALQYVKPPVDIYFIFAVMRQESIFTPNIVSPVGARGLMQFMPATGKTVAKEEGIKGFHEDLLYNPVMAIRLGNRYLGNLLLEFGGDPVYALANYNAGPVPAKRWLKEHAGLLLDTRVEEISYWETRDYVKKVMGNYWTYQAIYGRQ